MTWWRKRVRPVDIRVEVKDLPMAEADDGQCPAEVDAATGHYRCEVRASVPHDEHQRDGVRWRTFEGQEASEIVRELLAGIPVTVPPGPLTVVGMPEGVPSLEPRAVRVMHEWSRAEGWRGGVGFCECGLTYGDPLHIPAVPPEPEPETACEETVAEYLDRTRAVPVEDDAPETTPVPKPPPLPDGVIGYIVVLRGESGDQPADADMKRTFAAADAEAALHGRRPGWAGRVAVGEVRVVAR